MKIRLVGQELLCGKLFDELDKLHKENTEEIQQISYQHTLKLKSNQLSLVFYDVTTLYFRIEDPDDLPKAIFQITITLPFSKTKQSAICLPKEEQRNTSWIYLILPNLGCPSDKVRSNPGCAGMYYAC